MTSISTNLTLYRAPFVVPVTSAPIADGGVMVHNGRILAVDRFTRLRRESARVVDVENALLTPALINCHAHLELSYLEGLTTIESAYLRGDIDSSANFTDWIRTLLVKRGQSVPLESIVVTGRRALAQQYKRGVALVADIGNLAESRDISCGMSAEGLFYRELLAVTAKAAETLLSTLSDDEQCTAHSLYSCHPILLKALKNRSRRLGGLFPVHVAESIDEVTFLRTGTGPFRDFLIERLRLTGSLADGQGLDDLLPHPGCGAVEYLQSLGVLDERTICVHAVHLSEQEIELLAKNRAKVCLCPASNRKLNVGRAQVPLLLKHKIMPGLGTDSLASNDCLDLWLEMKVLQNDHPEVNPEQIFTKATFGGASTLRVESRLGSLVPGRDARLLAIDFSGQQSEIFPSLVNTGAAQKVTWLEGV
ncbi:MAG: amidohydrolase family protein [Desulfobulbaceae bacterium]|nr:amidohydrolase family protein [Desulfobulbaceae bacterium]